MSNSKKNNSGNGVWNWIKKHKKAVIITAIGAIGGITVIGGAVAFVKCSSNIQEQLDSLIHKTDDIPKIVNESSFAKYSNDWFSKVSDEVLKTEREKVRIDYNSSGDDDSKANRLEYLLEKFDEEMSKRAWGNKTPQGPAFQREGGWYLPNDD